MAKKDMNIYKQQMEQTLWENKTLSMTQKDNLEIYTNLVHSHAFKNNQISHVLAYVPDNIVVNEEGDGISILTKDGNSVVDLWNLSYDDIELYEEDNTLSEIISQKMNSFNKGKIVGMLNEDSETVKIAQGTINPDTIDPNNQQEIQTQAQERINTIQSYVTASTAGVTQYQNDILDMIEEAMYYPYSGIAAIYHNVDGEEVNVDELATRWVRFNTFTFDSDITTNDVDKADWVVITERIGYHEFTTRVKNGEYSEINYKEDDKNIENIWSRQSVYEFTIKNFPEQAISKNSTLRQNGFYQKIEKKRKGNKKEIEVINPNIYGVIDYMYQRNSEGGYNLYTYLNGDIISILKLDNKIDSLPVVLFSERPNIRKNINFKGNLGFKLLSSQKSILKANVMKEVSLKEASPFVSVKYQDDVTAVEDAIEIESIETLGNAITLLNLYSSNPVSANNSTRFMDGGQFYGTYLNMWDQQIQQIKMNMKERAGITEFAQGTASHSIESQSGINQMAVTGLKNEYDVVNAHATSIKRFMIMLGFSELSVLYGEEQNLETIQNIRLSDIMLAFEDVFKISFESAYQEEFTNGLIQTLIIPLAAQSGAIQQVLPLIKELPVTQTFKKGIDVMVEQMKQAAEEAQAQMYEEQRAAEENTNGQIATEEAQQKEAKKNTIKTGKSEDSGKNDKKTQKTTNGKKEADKKVESQKKTEESKKATRASQKQSKETKE